MTPDEIRQRAEEQTQEFYASLQGNDRKRRLREARELANFNATQLPADQPFNDQEFFTEWVNRLIQAAKILSETDLLKHLEAPPRNTNELFGVQVLKAAAEEDRIRCIELLQMGVTDPENQGIYSDGIRWAVWKHLEKLAFPSVDPVSSQFPLLASMGGKPAWLPHDWREAAWPTEPTREAVLQLVDWLLLCEKYPDQPAKQKALRRIGNYWKTLRDIESLLSILRSSGLSRTEMPEAPEDASHNLMVQRLKSLRERLAVEPPQVAEVREVGPEKKHPDDSTGNFLKLLKAITGDVADEKFRKAAEAIGGTGTVNEKLVAIHRHVGIPPSVPANQLGGALGVSANAIKKSQWWKENRYGKADERIEDRRSRHKEWAMDYENGASEDDE